MWINEISAAIAADADLLDHEKTAWFFAMVELGAQFPNPAGIVDAYTANKWVARLVASIEDGGASTATFNLPFRDTAMSISYIHERPRVVQFVEFWGDARDKDSPTNQNVKRTFAVSVPGPDDVLDASVAVAASLAGDKWESIAECPEIAFPQVDP